MAPVKYVENEMAKEFSKMRKNLSGRGTIKTIVNIRDDVMTVSANIDFSRIESLLFGFISSKRLDEEYHETYLKPHIRNEVTDAIKQHVPAAEIRDIHFNIDLAAGYYFVIVTFTESIENQIRQGKFNRPDPLIDDLNC